MFSQLFSSQLNSGIIFLMPSLIPFITNLWMNSIDELTHNKQKWDFEYDYIIVGGGSAGSVIANRLAHEKDLRILVIEAGGEPPPFSNLPIVAPFLQTTEIDWQYMTVPQTKSCLGLEGDASRWSRGKVLGGTSVMNPMIYMRGHSSDFKQWSKGLSSVDGWTWKDVENYYSIVEGKQYYVTRHKSTLKDKPEHQIKEHLYLQSPDSVGRLGKAFKLSGKNLKYPIVNHFNDGSKIGFGMPMVTIKNGIRISSADSYIRRVKKFKNLNIIYYSRAIQILINEAKEAYGVKFYRYGQNYTVKAKREVILSAGTIGSAHLLMLSGIGPSKHLKSHSIPVIEDLPVGQNLQDHYGVPFAFSTTNRSAISLARDLNIKEISKFILLKNGILSHPGFDAIAYINSHNTSIVPDASLYLYPYSYSSEDFGPALSKSHGLKEYIAKHYRKYKNSDTFTIHVSLLNPKSRGELTLNSNDPLDMPKIDPNYYSDINDTKEIIAAMKIAMKIGQSPQLKARLIPPLTIPKDVCSHEKDYYTSDRYLQCYSRILTITSNHAVGTCRMGPVKDATTVVDGKLRIKGIKNLRVGDASIMPNIVSAHPYATTVMIGEKLASIITKERAEKEYAVILTGGEILKNFAIFLVTIIGKLALWWSYGVKWNQLGYIN